MDWDARGDKQIFSERFKEMLGYPPETDTTKWPSLFDMMHPDDREPMRDAFREMLHRVSSTGERLHVTPKTLGRVVREQLGTTPTDLIRSRILTHAKWQLLHTLKPVKEVARELGFPDELYFSRLFKKATGRSPTSFREFETEIRGGSNLSILSADAPILPPAKRGDT